ncbi:MAG: cadherin-like domain-containing protein [Pseudomonadota bacterium]
MKFNRLFIYSAMVSSLVACGGDDDDNSLNFTLSEYVFTTSEDVPVDGLVSTNNTASVYTLTNAAENGVIALNADGSFTYTPNENFNGTDTATIQATADQNAVSTVISISVSPVNDAPQLMTETLKVRSASVTEFTLSATDVDGDTITFDLVTSPPEGTGTLTLNEDGSGSFSADIEDAPTGEFIISYTDGVIDTPIEATIDLETALTTSIDKANFYYSSEKSHLAEAENIKKNLGDDISAESISADLAVGYYLAGFDEIAEKHIADINTLSQQALAYRRAAIALDSVGRFEDSAELRALALVRYNQFVAEKGIDNFSQSDVEFFLVLNGEYTAAEQFEEAEQAIVALTNFIEANPDTSYYDFVQTLREYSTELINNYLDKPTDSQRARAVRILTTLFEWADQIPPSIESSGEFVGQPRHRLRLDELRDATKLAFTMNELDLAKEFLAKTLSYYGVVNYDMEHSYAAAPNAAVNINRALIPAEETAGLYAFLYPEAATNLVLDMIESTGDTFSLEYAQQSAYAADIVNAVKAGTPVNEVVTPIREKIVAETFFQPYLAVVNTLISKNPSTYGPAVILAREGFFEEAFSLVDITSDLLFTEEFRETILIDNTSVTGWLGCYRLTAIKEQFDGDAFTQSTECQDLALSYYTTESGAATDEAIDYQTDALHTIGEFGDPLAFVEMAEITFGEISILESATRRAERFYELASIYAKFDFWEQAFDTLQSAIDSAISAINADDADVETIATVINQA